MENKEAVRGKEWGVSGTSSLAEFAVESRPSVHQEVIVCRDFLVSGLFRLDFRYSPPLLPMIQFAQDPA